MEAFTWLLAPQNKTGVGIGASDDIMPRLFITIAGTLAGRLFRTRPMTAQ